MQSRKIAFAEQKENRGPDRTSISKGFPTGPGATKKTALMGERLQGEASNDGESVGVHGKVFAGGWREGKLLFLANEARGRRKN